MKMAKCSPRRYRTRSKWPHGLDESCNMVSREKLRRVLQYQLDHPDVHRAAQARYEQTKKGRLTKHRYCTSAKGRATNAANHRFQRRAKRLGWSPPLRGRRQ